MTKRALIIGSQTGGLNGVHADVAAIRQALDRFGFNNLDIRTGSNASREGILAGYEELIAAHRADDAAVIYYSGHGGRALNPSEPEGSPRQYLQFLVPTDFDTPGGGFRGIFAFELSGLLARLTATGSNVTIILDCCHAAMMSRDATTLSPRALPRTWTDGVEERLKEVAPLFAAAPEGNPNAVRLVATERDRSAYEAPRADGTVGGIMTDALFQAFGEADVDIARVNWAALGARVRELVIRRVPEQRPEVEGPSRRCLFQTKETGDAGGIVFFHDNGRPSLRAGHLLGAMVGAEYGVMPFGETRYLPEGVVANAVVTALEGSISRVTLDPGNAAIADGALAFPKRLPFGKRAVALDGPGAAVIVERSKFVAAAKRPEDAIATLRARDGTLSVFDAEGIALTDVVADNESGRNYVGEVLAGIARSDALRLLPAGDLPGALDVTWGRVEDGKRVPMNDGDMLHLGERVYVDVTNNCGVEIRMALLDLGIGGDVTLLTASVPSGVPILPGERYTIGERDGILSGLRTGWKQGVPTDGPRRESFVVIGAEEQTNFRALEGRVEAMARDQASRSPLDTLLAQIGAGTTRDCLIDSGGGRYAARHIEFQFSPDPRPVPGRRAHFAVDQSLAPAFLSREATVDGAYDGDIAIRLKRLIVHANRAFWRTDIRVDGLVVTGPAKGAAPYLPKTFNFPRIGDGDALPFDNLLIYDGRPSRYIDFSIWVSKAKSDSKPLSELFKDVLNDHEFQAAATVLAGLALAAPAASGLVAAAGAAGTVGYFADKVIRTAVGSSIGLYRTSFLSNEGFGVGRHPAAGMIRAQDFSFAFEVEVSKSSAMPRAHKS